MLKTLLAAALTAVPFVASAQAMPAVQWRVEQGDSSSPGEVQFSIEYRTPTSRSMNSHTTTLDELTGLTAAQLGSASGAQVRFRLARDAGTLDCTGLTQRGHGLGDCGFTPNGVFAAELQHGGSGAATPMQLFSLTLSNIGRRYLGELHRQHYATPSVEELVAAGNHGVTFSYLQGIGANGYHVGTTTALVRMRDHGVTPDYIARFGANGVRGVTPEMLVKLRDHGVTPTFVADMRAIGYGGYSVDELISLRDHGISTEFARQLRQAGYGDLTAASLTRLRDSGVNSAYVQELHDLGYARLTVDDMVRLRNSGVTAGFIQRVNANGRRSVEELVRLRNSGA